MYRIGKEEIDAAKRVIESKQLFRINDQAKEAENFEKELANKVGVKYSLLLSGGTCALIAALVGVEIGPGDEVIIPGYTFMATAIAVLAVGAIPVIVDIDESLTIDVVDIERKITKHTKAIIPVHICGFPCNMEKIMQIAKKYNLKVVEDACQADGGSYKNMRLGTIGDVGAYSFNHFKIISAGEGGSLITNDRIVYERALIYHDGGCAFRPYAKDLLVPIFIGVQNRVSEITGAILREQLKKLDIILDDLRKIKKNIMGQLDGISGIKFIKSYDLEGDCGTTLGFSFDNEISARAFATSDGVKGMLPIDSDKHVYKNWLPVLSKRGGHHPGLNPYLMPQNKDCMMDYSIDMCSATLDILSRTVFISLHPDMDNDSVDNTVLSCTNAVKHC